MASSSYLTFVVTLKSLEGLHGFRGAAWTPITPSPLRFRGKCASPAPLPSCPSLLSSCRASQALRGLRPDLPSASGLGSPAGCSFSGLGGSRGSQRIPNFYRPPLGQCANTAAAVSCPRLAPLLVTSPLPRNFHDCPFRLPRED